MASSATPRAATPIAPRTPAELGETAPPVQRGPRFRGEFPPSAQRAAQPGSSAATPGSPTAKSATAASAKAPPPPPAPGQPLLPGDHWSSARAQWVRQVLLLAAAACAGILLALVAVSLLANRGCGRSDRDSQTAQTGQTDSQPGPSAASTPPGTPADETETPADPTSDDPLADSPPAPGTQPQSEAPDMPTPEPPAAVDTPPNESPPPDASSPPKPDAGSPDMATGPPKPNGSPKPQPPSRLPNIPPVGPGTESTQPPSAPPPPPPIPTDAAGKPAADAPPAVDAAKQLDLALLSVEFEGMKLVDFADFLHDLTAIAVTLDIDGIVAKGPDADTTLSVNLRGATVRQMAESALQPHGLVLAVLNNQLVITTPERLDGTLEERTLGIADLVSDEARAQRLAEYMVAQIAPEWWQATGGAGSLSVAGQSLVVRQQPVVIQRMVRLLDRLRTAQGLLPRSELPAEQVAVEPLYVQAAERLAKPISANFAAAVPVSRILGFLETECDLRLLVDWQSLAAAGWTPSSEGTLVADNEPLAATLDRWLAPAGLTFRMLDGNTLQITSQAACEQQPVIELYPVPKESQAKAGEDLVQRVHERVGAAYFQTNRGRTAIWYDAVSHCLLVALPEPWHRRIELGMQRKIENTEKKIEQKDTEEHGE